MTRRAPQDGAFNKAVRVEIQGPVSERIVFFDHHNEVREAVYRSEFQSGELRRIRERLVKQGELKGVAYVSAHHLGTAGPRTTVVEYLPDHSFHFIQYQPRKLRWASGKPDLESVQEEYQALFSEANGEENDT